MLHSLLRYRWSTHRQTDVTFGTHHHHLVNMLNETDEMIAKLVSVGNFVSTNSVYLCSSDHSNEQTNRQHDLCSAVLKQYVTKQANNIHILWRFLFAFVDFSSSQCSNHGAAGDAGKTIRSRLLRPVESNQTFQSPSLSKLNKKKANRN